MVAYVSLETQIKNFIKKKNLSSLKFESGKSISDVLKEEAKKLISIIEEEIDRLVYSQPESKWYKRTGDLRNSIDKNISIDPKTNTITIGFLEDKAWHDSAITKYKDSSYDHKAFVPLMVNEGFRTLDTSGDRWYKSHNWYEGTHFLESAIERYNQVKHPGINVKLEKTDKWW